MQPSIIADCWLLHLVRGGEGEQGGGGKEREGEGEKEEEEEEEENKHHACDDVSIAPVSLQVCSPVLM